MGLAASQARFLGLTARKVNIEYEGQQVNQQRTVLSNESAGLYQQLYSLKVPTPPSVTDYYKTEYSYNAGNTKYTVNSYNNSTDYPGNYKVNVSYKKDVTTGGKNNTNGDLTEDADNYYLKIGTTGSAYTLNKNDVIQDSILDEASGYTQGYYIYSENNVVYYLGKEWCENNVPIRNNEIERWTKGTNSKTITEDHDNCELKFDSSTGYINSILDPSVSQSEISVNADSIQDTVGYEQAMKKYTSDKDKYEKELAEINAQTEEIQQEDRGLELRLRQLDTEQEALQTELDSVKSVIDKNVEAVFKVFA